MTGPVETKVTAATLAAVTLPFVEALLEALVAFGIPFSPEQRAALLQLVTWLLPVVVFTAAWRAPHTFRHDLAYPPAARVVAAQAEPDGRP